MVIKELGGLAQLIYRRWMILRVGEMPLSRSAYRDLYRAERTLRKGYLPGGLEKCLYFLSMVGIDWTIYIRGDEQFGELDGGVKYYINRYVKRRHKKTPESLAKELTHRLSYSNTRVVSDKSYFRMTYSIEDFLRGDHKGSKYREDLPSSVPYMEEKLTEMVNITNSYLNTYSRLDNIMLNDEFVVIGKERMLVLYYIYSEYDMKLSMERGIPKGGISRKEIIAGVSGMYAFRGSVMGAINWLIEHSFIINVRSNMNHQAGGLFRCSVLGEVKCRIFMRTITYKKE